MAIRNQLLAFIGGGVVFGGLTFWLTSQSGNAEETQESGEQQYQSMVQSNEVTHSDNTQNMQKITSTGSTEKRSNAKTSVDNNESAMLTDGEASLVESLEDGRMLINSDQFSQMVNAQDFALAADELVYRHPVSKSQQAYETEADIERLLQDDEYVRGQDLEVDYFKCSNDYCVLSVDTISKEQADEFFNHFANTDREYASFVQGGGAFSVVQSNHGASARLAFGISDGFRL